MQKTDRPRRPRFLLRGRPNPRTLNSRFWPPSGRWPLVLGLVTAASPAFALPGFIAGKGNTARVSNTTQVVLLEKGDHTVVTVWADYEGPLDQFALVLPVPADVDLEDVKTLKRDAIDKVDRKMREMPSRVET